MCLPRVQVGQSPANQSTPGIEADLDVQYITSIGGAVNTTYWYTAGQRPDENEPFLAWLLAIEQLSDAQLPSVFSVSYGDNENTVDIDVSAEWGVLRWRMAAGAATKQGLNTWAALLPPPVRDPLQHGVRKGRRPRRVPPHLLGRRRRGWLPGLALPRRHLHPELPRSEPLRDGSGGHDRCVALYGPSVGRRV